MGGGRNGGGLGGRMGGVIRGVGIGRGLGIRKFGVVYIWGCIWVGVHGCLCSTLNLYGSQFRYSIARTEGLILRTLAHTRRS